MQEEQSVRHEGRSATDPLTPGAAGVSSMPLAPSMEHVPSDQLWRAAVMAARQAAVTAAELRRAFDASIAMPTPIVEAAAPAATSGASLTV